MAELVVAIVLLLPPISEGVKLASPVLTGPLGGMVTVRPLPLEEVVMTSP